MIRPNRKGITMSESTIIQALIVPSDPSEQTCFGFYSADINTSDGTLPLRALETIIVPEGETLAIELTKCGIAFQIKIVRRQPPMTKKKANSLGRMAN
jgi:hypothetical protein